MSQVQISTRLPRYRRHGYGSRKSHAPKRQHHAANQLDVCLNPLSFFLLIRRLITVFYYPFLFASSHLIITVSMLLRTFVGVFLAVLGHLGVASASQPVQIMRNADVHIDVINKLVIIDERNMEWYVFKARLYRLYSAIKHYI